MQNYEQPTTTYSVGIRTNFIRPEAGQEYHELIYKFDKTLKPELVRMRLAIFCLLDKCRDQTYRVRISLRQIYDECGFHMDRNYKIRKTYQNIIAAIDLLAKDGFIFSLQKRIEDCRADEQITFHLNNEVWSPNHILNSYGGYTYLEPYVIFDSGKFDKLATNPDVKLQDALYVYLYMLSFMAYRKNGTEPEEQPRYYYSGFEKIATGTRLSIKTVSKILNVLCDLQILHRDSVGLGIDHGKSPYFYVDGVEGWERELEAAKSKLRHDASQYNIQSVLAEAVQPAS